VPIVFAPLVGVVFGVTLAWFARTPLARDEGPLVASRAFVLVCALAGLVYTPIVGYFVAFHGDWSYLYLVPWMRIPSALDLALVLVAGSSVVFGFAVAAKPARAQRLGTLTALAGVPAVVTCVLCIVWQRRLSISATYGQFHGDFGTEPLTASSLGRGVLWMGLVGLLGVGWCAFSVREGVPTLAPRSSIAPRRPAR